MPPFEDLDCHHIIKHDNVITGRVVVVGDACIKVKTQAMVSKSCAQSHIHLPIENTHKKGGGGGGGGRKEKLYSLQEKKYQCIIQLFKCKTKKM